MVGSGPGRLLLWSMGKGPGSDDRVDGNGGACFCLGTRSEPRECARAMLGGGGTMVLTIGGTITAASDKC